jgi:hypothetical protein
MQKNTARHPPAACASRVVRDETIKRARDKYHKVIFIRADKFVGWVERVMPHSLENPTLRLHGHKSARKKKGLHRCRPLSYWCRLTDSNCRPTAYKSIAHRIYQLTFSRILLLLTHF